MAFIRRKRVHKRPFEEQKDYFYYYRVENYRADNCPRHKQQVLNYLGTAEEAIAKLKISKASQEEKAKLLARLQNLIGEELSTTPQV